LTAHTQHHSEDVDDDEANVDDDKANDDDYRKNHGQVSHSQSI
jgi:hypothetical protein